MRYKCVVEVLTTHTGILGSCRKISFFYQRIHYSIVPVFQYSISFYALALTGNIAFSGHICAQTAQPVQRFASIFTRSFQI